MREKAESNNYYKMIYSGTSPTNFINALSNKGIRIVAPTRTKNGLLFYLDSPNYVLWKTIDSGFYPVEVIKVGGVKFFFKNILCRLGLLVGLIVCIVFMMIFNNKILQIHIFGLENVSKEEVITELKNNGVYYLGSSNIDKSFLEQHISKTFDFSLVSVVVRGNSLIINIKESLPQIEDKYVPITADYNMVIEEITVYSGTSTIKPGSIVYKGDVLVFPYYTCGNDVVYVCPCATIKATVYFNSTYSFKNKQYETSRTGKKQLISYVYMLGKNKIFSQARSLQFADYEVVKIEQNISQYILPISIQKVYAYEIVKEEKNVVFEEKKDDILARVKEDAYSQVPSHINISDEDIKLTQVADGVIVNVYLTSLVEFKYQFKE